MTQTPELLELLAAARDMLNFGQHDGDCDALGSLSGACSKHLDTTEARELRLTAALEACRTRLERRIGLTFGEALTALQQGARVRRAGWNGKNMFLFLLPAADGIPTTSIYDPGLRKVIEEEVGGDRFDALGSIRMFTADKKILTGWLASQTDMLVADWELA